MLKQRSKRIYIFRKSSLGTTPVTSLGATPVTSRRNKSLRPGSHHHTPVSLSGQRSFRPANPHHTPPVISGGATGHPDTPQPVNPSNLTNTPLVGTMKKGFGPNRPSSLHNIGLQSNRPPPNLHNTPANALSKTPAQNLSSNLHGTPANADKIGAQMRTPRQGLARTDPTKARAKVQRSSSSAWSWE